MKIGIVGGQGRMGQVFVELFRSRGIECLVSDLNTKLSNAELVRQSEIVIFSLPISSSIETIKSLMSEFRENQLLADLTSIKLPVVNAMLESKSEVLGLHPLFGPGLSDLKNQKIIYCPARRRELSERLLALFSSAGILLKECTPEKHDQLMSVVQGLNHVTSLIWANAISRMGVDLAETLDFATPIYKIRMDLIGRILSQSPEMYADMALGNSSSFDAFSCLLQSTNEMQQIFDKNDKQAFVEYFKKTSKYFDSIQEEGLKSSQGLIDFISKNR